MKIDFIYSEACTICDRCGRHIKNIYTISDNANTYHVGCECINKVTNVSEFGIEVIKKSINKIKKYEKQLKALESGDQETIKKLNICVKDEEDRIHWIEKTIPFRINQELKELNKKIAKIDLKSLAK